MLNFWIWVWVGFAYDVREIGWHKLDSPGMHAPYTRPRCEGVLNDLRKIAWLNGNDSVYTCSINVPDWVPDTADPT
jgi:hypothetical protein